MLFRRTQPSPCKTGRITGCNILPYFVRSFPSLQQKITMPFPVLDVNSFCLFSSKAVPLTGLRAYKDCTGFLRYSTDKQFRQKSGRTMADCEVEGHCSYCRSKGPERPNGAIDVQPRF
jgi:hypothetical protein